MSAAGPFGGALPPIAPYWGAISSLRRIVISPLHRLYRDHSRPLPTIRLIPAFLGEIPDFRNRAASTIIKVKNKPVVNFTSQLRDTANSALKNIQRFELWVRDGARLSDSLQEAGDQGLLIVREFEWR
jgi:hypothetical protein